MTSISSVTSQVSADAHKKQRLLTDPAARMGDLPVRLIAIARQYLNVQEVLRTALVSRYWSTGINLWANVTLVLDFPQISWAKSDVMTKLFSFFNRYSFPRLSDLRVGFTYYRPAPPREFDWLKPEWENNVDSKNIEENVLERLLEDRTAPLERWIKMIGEKHKVTSLTLRTECDQFPDQFPRNAFAKALGSSLVSLDLTRTDFTMYDEILDQLPKLKELRMAPLAMLEFIEDCLVPALVEIGVVIHKRFNSYSVDEWWERVTKLLVDHCNKAQNNLSKVVITIDEREIEDPPYIHGTCIKTLLSCKKLEKLIVRVPEELVDRTKNISDLLEVLHDPRLSIYVSNEEEEALCNKHTLESRFQISDPQLFAEGCLV